MKKILLLVVSFILALSINAQDFTEDFQTVTVDEDINLTGWTNQAVEGTRVFIGKYYDGDDNYYAQMSAYNSGEATEIVWLVTPGLVVSASSILNFETKLAYMTHDPAYVGISTDFSGDAAAATWDEVTYTHATAPPDGYGDWTASGDVDLSSYDGQTIYIGFKYSGGDPGETTTLQLDNVNVTDATVASIKSVNNNKISVFPNPAVNVLNISEVSDLIVYNIAGQEVLTAENTKNVDVSALESGVYFIEIQSVKGVSVKKFVVK